MYIKLTKQDKGNPPIWINAAFVVTVEPGKQGGSVVVPIGDGLDYDVCESPEEVLVMLGDAPAATVVPLPPPKSLTAKPDDVSAEPEVMTAADADDLAPDEKPKPQKRIAKAKSAAKPKATKRTAKAKAAASALTAEQVERLRGMAPGSLKKLANTLSTQFKVEDTESEIRALAEKGVLHIDRDHVNWQQPEKSRGEGVGCRCEV